LVYLKLCIRIYPNIRQVAIDANLLKALFTFGGWVTIGSIVGQIISYSDRFFIGMLLPIANVGYYSVSADMLTRLGVLPGSFAKTLFPAFSTIQSNKENLERLYVRSLKYILLIMGPIVLVLVVLASPILQIWLGREWASKTTLIFQLLSIGLLFNALTLIPAHLLDGIGRPDLRAKVFISYFFPYIFLLWILTSKFGIAGTATAFTFRAVINLLLFFWIGWKTICLDNVIFINNGMRRSIVLYVGLVAIVSLLIAVFGNTLLVDGFITIVCLLFFVFVAWKYVLDISDKQPLYSLLKKITGA
jgi:O-antigen/teichoic acid export membrane protein